MDAENGRTEVCTCYFECGDCDYSGNWHTHTNDAECQIHPDAPSGDVPL